MPRSVIVVRAILEFLQYAQEDGQCRCTSMSA
jgi:hypothetical protein